MTMIKTFYDSLSRRYFRATTDDVLEAEKILANELIETGHFNLNHFYSRLNVDEIQLGDILNYYDWKGAIDYLEMVHTRAVLDDGMEIYIISFQFWPRNCWLNDI